MRVPLIFPIQVEIMQTDLPATAGDPDGAGARTSGFDPDYHEPVRVPSADRLGVSAIKESDPLILPAQIEPATMDRLSMIGSGDLKRGSIVLVFHFQDLEDLGLLHPTTGVAMIKTGDRLRAMRRITGELIQSFPNPPGLFVTDATPIGMGFDGTRNLLKVTFETNDQGA